MIQTLLVQTAKQKLDELLKQLHIGETITLVDSEGKPLAIMVSLNPPETSSGGVDWDAWEKLAQEVGRAWSSDKSATEVIAEMRR